MLDDSSGEMVQIAPTGGQYHSTKEQKLNRKYPPSVTHPSVTSVSLRNCGQNMENLGSG
ncbi:MAG: hypothetical protein VB144_15490 [Clostridia bacterium]|nr:hypothetical protein [Clostridia bacterium]